MFWLPFSSLLRWLVQQLSGSLHPREWEGRKVFHLHGLVWCQIVADLDEQYTCTPAAQYRQHQRSQPQVAQTRTAYVICICITTKLIVNTASNGGNNFSLICDDSYITKCWCRPCFVHGDGILGLFEELVLFVHSLNKGAIWDCQWSICRVCTGEVANLNNRNVELNLCRNMTS